MLHFIMLALSFGQIAAPLFIPVVASTADQVPIMVTCASKVICNPKGANMINPLLI